MSDKWFKDHQAYVDECDEVQRRLSELVRKGNLLAPKGKSITLLPDTVKCPDTMEMTIEKVPDKFQAAPEVYYHVGDKDDEPICGDRSYARHMSTQSIKPTCPRCLMEVV